MMPDSIVVAGSLAQKPHQAGHTWQFLQYLLGFKELGWDVLFVDRLEPEMCIDAEGAPCPVERSVNIAYVQAVMEEFGLADSWAVLYGDGARVYGVPRPEVLERTRRSALLGAVALVLGACRTTSSPDAASPPSTASPAAPPGKPPARRGT